MSISSLKTKHLLLVVMLCSLVGLFFFVALRSGPLAPIAVTLSTVESRSITPELTGIGNVQARYTYKIGPIINGKLRSIKVNVGDTVYAGQVLGEMDTIDLDQKIHAQEAAIKTAEAAVVQAAAKEEYAKTQARRYEQLILTRGTSEEMLLSKQQELAIASATLSASLSDLARFRAEKQVLIAQQQNLELVASADGLVAARNAEPGSTVVAGQTIIELIDPASLWVNTRFDQHSAEGLTAGLQAEIILRSRQSQTLPGTVLWVEPKADAVTEEMLAKIIFAQPPLPLPSVGELAEITVKLPALAPGPSIPIAAIRSLQGQRGVWKVDNDNLEFVPVILGRTDLAGHVQVLQGLEIGDSVVVYSEKTLGFNSRIKVTEAIPGAGR